MASQSGKRKKNKNFKRKLEDNAKRDTRKRGTIVGIHYQAGSGLVEITIKDHKTGEIRTLGADASPTFSSFEAAFGSIGNAKGQDIYYSQTSYGTMSGFLPVAEAEEM